MPDKNVIIVAPHPDDEIIGCFEIIKTFPTMIIYDADTPNKRREEAMKLKDEFDVMVQLFQKSIPPNFMSAKETVLFFPDPSYETHPLHRQWGQLGESIARSGQNVIFYTTNMNTPYIYETEHSRHKELTLNKFYKSQKSMWAFDHKYFLFEGYSSWKFDIKGEIYNGQ